MYPTLADSYDAWIDADRGQKERVRFYDIQGQVNPHLYLHFFFYF